MWDHERENGPLGKAIRQVREQVETLKRIAEFNQKAWTALVEDLVTHFMEEECVVRRPSKEVLDVRVEIDGKVSDLLRFVFVEGVSRPCCLVADSNGLIHHMLVCSSSEVGWKISPSLEDFAHRLGPQGQAERYQEMCEEADTPNWSTCHIEVLDQLCLGELQHVV